MLKEFRLQDPGEGIHEVEVHEIFVKPGDHVTDGHMAFVVESDKAAIELSSPYHGTVKDIPVSVGDTIRVGDVLMTVDTDSAEDGAGVTESSTAEAPTAEKSPAVSSKPEDRAKAPASSAQSVEKVGLQGRSAFQPSSGSVVKAAPTARRLAKEKDISLADVPATGSRGHVTRQDVERYMAAESRPVISAAVPDTLPLPDFSKFGPIRREPLKSIRKATAKHMAKAWAEIPHVMLEDRLDLTHLEQMRKRQADQVAQKGGQLTLLVFVIKALSIALKEHPRFNASLDMARGEIIEKDYINIGIATDSDRGLLVPVLRDVDRKSLIELAIDLKELVDRVRSGRAGPEDLSGGTMSITNMGAMGGTGFFPIINHPEVAILGMGRGKLEPVIIGDINHYHVEARYIVPFSLSFDHRLNDGGDAARFLASFRTILSDVEQLTLYA